VAGMSLRGSIDLVERKGSMLRATDHKTGRAATAQRLQIGGGKVLQPVLYALVLEKLFAEVDGEVDGGRLYYCTARGGFETREVKLDDTAREAAESLSATIDGAISEGFLPAAPDRDACEFCDYRVVCGPYEQLRTRRKRSARLQGLRALRTIE